MRHGPSETDYSSMNSELQLLPENLLLHGSSTCCTFLLTCPPASAWGHSSMDCTQISAPLQSSMGCRRAACPTTVLSKGLQGNFCSSAWTTFSLPSSVTLMSPEVLVWLFLILLCHSCWAAFLSILKYDIREELAAGGHNFGQWQALLGAICNWLCLIWGQFLLSSHGDQLYSPFPVTKPSHKAQI